MAHHVNPELFLKPLLPSENTTMIHVESYPFRIGRDEPAFARLKQSAPSCEEAVQHMSRGHAAIEFRHNQIELVDMGSKNGTVHNGRRLNTNERIELSDGDTISFGGVLAYEVALSEGTSKLKPPAVPAADEPHGPTGTMVMDAPPEISAMAAKWAAEAGNQEVQPPPEGPTGTMVMDAEELRKLEEAKNRGPTSAADNPGGEGPTGTMIMDAEELRKLEEAKRRAGNAEAQAAAPSQSAPKQGGGCLPVLLFGAIVGVLLCQLF